MLDTPPEIRYFTNMPRIPLILFAMVSLLSAGESAFAQDPNTGVEQEKNTIIVTRETNREAVKALGEAIVRRSRTGHPVARFDGPICVKVAGLPENLAKIVKKRIDMNISGLRGVSVGKEGCKPNAFVGVLNEVNAAVDRLRKEEPWLFDGLLDNQIKRIYLGSEAVRAWHVFSLRNLDRTPIFEAEPSSNELLSVSVNRVEKASRTPLLRSVLNGAVVLIETEALDGKTLRQVADYSTFRLLASISDEVGEERAGLSTILSLFSGQEPPAESSDFDRAYLDALYELPPNSRDTQVISAAVSHYIKGIETATESAPEG